MFIDISTVRVFVRPGHTDMRKQSFGLSVIVTEDLGKDPFSGSLFLFCNKWSSPGYAKLNIAGGSPIRLMARL